MANPDFTDSKKPSDHEVEHPEVNLQETWKLLLARRVEATRLRVQANRLWEADGHNTAGRDHITARADFLRVLGELDFLDAVILKYGPKIRVSWPEVGCDIGGKEFLSET